LQLQAQLQALLQAQAQSCRAPAVFCSLPHVYILLAICSSFYLGVLTLVAAGRVAAPDANRITLKRIVLTALPYKLKKVQ
jgi:hypothetical protein